MYACVVENMENPTKAVNSLITLFVEDNQLLDLPPTSNDLKFRSQFTQVAIVVEGISAPVCAIDKKIMDKNKDHKTFGADLMIVSSIAEKMTIRQIKDELNDVDDSDCQLSEFNINFRDGSPKEEDITKFLTICALYCSKEATRTNHLFKLQYITIFELLVHLVTKLVRN